MFLRRIVCVDESTYVFGRWWSNNLIKWCQRDHLLEGILKGLRERAAGLKLFIVSICQYPNAQFTSTGSGPPISSNGTITGSGKSHFRYCIYCSFFSFSCSIAHSVTDQRPLSKILAPEKHPSAISKIRKAVRRLREKNLEQTSVL